MTDFRLKSNSAADELASVIHRALSYLGNPATSVLTLYKVFPAVM